MVMIDIGDVNIAKESLKSLSSLPANEGLDVLDEFIDANEWVVPILIKLNDLIKQRDEVFSDTKNICQYCGQEIRYGNISRAGGRSMGWWHYETISVNCAPKEAMPMWETI